MQMLQLLQDMVGQGASDLHIKAGSPPGYRIDGEVRVQQQYGILPPELTAELCRQIMSPEQWERYAKEHDLDFSYAVKDLARFRVNALTQRGSCGLVIRQIPDTVPDHKKLGLPQICLDLAAKPRGMVLVTGPTGSGKSTTLAAMINLINETEHGHILTMEDPLEFVHPDKCCFVTQRQIGQDCSSFREGLRRALRQDPDVILIGEMRDLETISMAITAAETGHLVFGTLHTTSAISTVDRIIDVFPTDAQQQVRVQLSGTLQGVISQTLVPKIGGGRIAAREILVATDAVRSLIRESKSAQMLNIMQTGRAHGMSTLEDELLRLYNEGQITSEDAIAKSNRPEDVKKRISESGPAARTSAVTPANPAPRFGSGPSITSKPPSGLAPQGVKMRLPGRP
ncbi:MAG TPA: type IV pilus twitching motility protein PilT [Planctomycetota bacterium]|nr:type IV pilus twitching motility protein PilT [Planctomycetota bacterium]